jgi:Terminase large subunit, T4likevirus-type, N-terminal
MVATQEQTKTIWKPNRGGQWLFLCCPYWESLADGDRGGGKTTTLIHTFLAHVNKGHHEDWRGVIFRLSYPQLKDIIDMSKIIIKKSFPHARYVGGEEKAWTFETGEVLMFRHLENLKAYDNYHGHAYPFLGFEELTSWPSSEPYEAMTSCSRRRSDNINVPVMIRSTTNPYGVGHSWVKQRFITGKKPNIPYGKPGRGRIRIPMLWQENIVYMESDPDYHVRLAENITNEAQRRAWTANDWNIVAGGRFSDVWKESIHVMEPFNIPQNWTIDRSHDWGSSAPFCTLWYAESNGEAIEDGRRWPKGTLFVISEDYGCAGDLSDTNWKPNVGLQLTPDEIAERVNRNEASMRQWGLIQKKPLPGPGDDPLFDVSRGGQSMAKQMANYGVTWLKPKKGPGSRVTGWQLIEGKLKESLRYPMEKPGLFVFDTCIHLIRTLPTLPRDPKKPDDLDTSSEDHGVDSLRLRILAGSNGPISHGVSL